MTVATAMVMVRAVAVVVTTVRAVTMTMAIMVMMTVVMIVWLLRKRGSRGCSRCYFRSLNIGWLLKHSRLECITLFFRKRHRTLSTLLHLFLLFSLALFYILKLKSASILLLEEGHTSL